jgi:hypothetical protein
MVITSLTINHKFQGDVSKMINARYTYTQDNVPFVCDLSVLCTVLLHNKSSFA